MRIDVSFPLGAKISVINLPEDRYDPPTSLAVTVAGWGLTETDAPVFILRKVDISVRDCSACEFPSVGREVTPRMLCAGETGKSVCHGDSGSALVSGSTRVGISSWGSGMCTIGGRLR
ncbi:trypsin alpha-3-like [Schistocerca americana]|uniref:trypsin alpha-3-like n=1 Tax=Schistocerca americana TaxID=7009 RepID=UPI001F4F1E11|nr:trypsin alpha-3-like [Schistocerca americana]